MLKKLIKYKLFGAKDDESIKSALERKKIHIIKRFDHRSISEIELKQSLCNIGLEKGDNVVVHASWRQFYNYAGKPENVIETLREIIGEEGTLLMPSYASEGPSLIFDVENTPSKAGVLSEIFRVQKNVVRSECNHFSVCAQGPLARELTKDHIFSEYGFDNNSPYYKLANLEGSKILFLGLGKRPTKISVFHCAGYLLKDNIPYFSNLISEKYTATLIVQGKCIEKKMLTRRSEYSNNDKNFKKIFDSVENKKHSKISNLNLVILDANEALLKAVSFAQKGIYCYK